MLLRVFCRYGCDKVVKVLNVLLHLQMGSFEKWKNLGTGLIFETWLVTQFIGIIIGEKYKGKVYSLFFCPLVFDILNLIYFHIFGYI